MCQKVLKMIQELRVFTVANFLIYIKSYLSNILENDLVYNMDSIPI